MSWCAINGRAKNGVYLRKPFKIDVLLLLLVVVEVVAVVVSVVVVLLLYNPFRQKSCQTIFKMKFSVASDGIRMF